MWKGANACQGKASDFSSQRCEDRSHSTCSAETQHSVMGGRKVGARVSPSAASAAQVAGGAASTRVPCPRPRRSASSSGQRSETARGVARGPGTCATRGDFSAHLDEKTENHHGATKHASEAMRPSSEGGRPVSTKLTRESSSACRNRSRWFSTITTSITIT